MRPVEWQLMSMLSLSEVGLVWPAWREILRVSCCSPEPSDAEMDQAYGALADEGRIRVSGGGALFACMDAEDVRKARCLAAAAFGPLDAEALLRLALHARRASGDAFVDVGREMDGVEREKAMCYLRDISPRVESAWGAGASDGSRWDEVVEDMEKALAPFCGGVGPHNRGKASEKSVAALLVVERILVEAPEENEIPETLLDLVDLEVSLVNRARDGAPAAPGRRCTWRSIRKALDDGTTGLPAGAAAALGEWVRSAMPRHRGETAPMMPMMDEQGALLDILLDAGDSVSWFIVHEDWESRQSPCAMRAEGGSAGQVRPGMAALSASDIERRDVELETEAGEDGSLTIRLPPLALLAAGDGVVLEDAGGRYVWWRVCPAARAIMDVMDRHGGLSVPAAALTFPTGVAERVRTMLAAAASAGLPVRGAVTSAGDAASLKRVAGTARIVARLERLGDVLRVTLMAKPVPDSPDMLFPPGRGRVEIAVPRTQDPFLLVRDMDAERDAAEGVGAALGDFADARRGEREWAVSGEARALALLDALRVAVEQSGGALEAEWKAQPSERMEIVPVRGLRLKGGRDAEWWLSVDGELELGNGERLELRRMVEAMPLRVAGFVPLGGGMWARLTDSLKRRLEALAASGDFDGGGLKVSRAALPMLAEAFADGGEGESCGGWPGLPGELAEAAARIREGLAARHAVPEGLAARLRPYQEEGFEWLARLAGCGIGACLADDMGLGKTVQLLAVLLERAGEGPSLVVAPASVCGNWCAEAARFAPSLRVIRAADAAALPGRLGAGDLVVASYGLIVSRSAQFEEVRWNGVVLDEAQAIKNAGTSRAGAARRLKSRWRCVATGTPVENRLSDLWSIFDFLNPGLLGGLPKFRQRFLDADGRPNQALRTLVRPLILRRLKGDVLRDLPPKTEITITVEPGDAEREAYEALRKVALDDIRADRQGARMRMLAALTRLRRFCCSPSLVVAGAGIGAKLEALESLLGDLRENGHRALVFSQFTDVLALVRPIMERNGWGYEYLDGATPQVERTRRVAAFQSGETPFFLVSLKAGGTGLNLTAASYVVLLDPWWNPAVEDQAADRAHRIGQIRPVTVYRLVVKGTVEEKVLELHGEKRLLSAAVLDGTSDAALSESDLMALLRPSAEGH